jgi:hypothetical protein
MKRIAIGIMMVAGLWLSTAVVRGSVIAVNFDASVNHLDGTTALGGYASSGDSVGDYDFDGSSDDRATYVPMGTVFAPVLNAKYVPVAGQSDTMFYQGVSIARIDDVSSAAPAVGLNRITTTLIQVGNTAASASETFRIASAFYWKAEDFLNGKIKLADETGSIQFTGSSVSANWYAHALIETGGKWYVSDTQSKSALSVNGATETWYEFDPVANNMFWNEAGKGDGVLGSTLGEITSAGVYFQETYSGLTPRWHFESLSVSGTAVPEPATFGMLGMGALCMLFFRRWIRA